MIILVGSNKGGAGKTTTAITIASGLAKQYDVCLVDADKQHSASRWSSDREYSSEELPQITVIQKYDNLQPTLNNLKEKYDHIIIDVAGRNSRELITAMLCADIVISPAQCSQLDLDTLTELQEQVTRAKDLNPRIKVFIYHVMAATNPKLAPINKKEFNDFVKEFNDFRLLKSISCYRKAYRDVIVNGKSILEQTQDLKAKSEGENLINEILELTN